MIKQIPNLLTILRFILILFIAYYINTNNYIVALLFFTISAFTDILDGYLARKLNAISNFGKLMDPLADKLTQLTTLGLLVKKQIIPSWILVIIFVKEIFLIIGAAFLYGKNVVVFSRWYGKFATVMLYIAIVFSMIVTLLHLESFYLVIEKSLYIIAIFTTCVALVLYLKDLLTQGIIDKSDITKDVTTVSLKNKKDISKDILDN